MITVGPALSAPWAMVFSGKIKVFIWVATTRTDWFCLKKPLSCSSRYPAGDFPGGSLCRITSNIFAFIFYRFMLERTSTLSFRLREACPWSPATFSRQGISCGVDLGHFAFSPVIVDLFREFFQSPQAHRLNKV